jgi:hypothetical protein
MNLPLDRLMEILAAASDYVGSERCDLITRTLAAILYSSFLNFQCWGALRGHAGAAQVIRNSLLLDTQSEVRDVTRKLMEERTLSSKEYVANRHL